ncbi:cytochrome P450 9e2-like, partial [Diaphorina citri]|uniref:Cytochrome P450 9e2-like n=1 Tax=Diaphorina citri TaxID=121845 RepID=A0A3Q0IQ47_DIACI
MNDLLGLLLSWPIILISTLTFLYWHFTKTYDHWKKRGVVFEKPILLFGNLKERMLFRQSFHEYQRDAYFKFEGHPYAGLYEGRRPSLMLRDPELIKHVMVRDFEHFVDRPTFRLRSPAYTRNMLINLKGNEWKQVRQIMTPAFTSGKLKQMHSLVEQCGKQMEEYFDSNITEGNPKLEIELKDFLGRFTLDVIATCAFGVESNSIKFPESELICVMAKFGDIPVYKRVILFMIIVFIPMFARFIPLSLFNSRVMEYLVALSKKVAHMRKTEGVRRNDFLQLMVEHQDDSNAPSDDVIKVKTVTVGENGETKQKVFLSEDTVTAQSILFLIAGYETSSTLLMFASYQLSLNVDIQDKLRAHVNEILDKHGGKCTYEALQDMSYLEMVLNETLRMHPSVARVDRHCTLDYTLPDTNIVIRAGESVNVPIMGLHYDPKYYPDPYKFDPDRFLPEEKAKRSPYVFLPFGAGPRNCIGNTT